MEVVCLCGELLLAQPVDLEKRNLRLHFGQLCLQLPLRSALGPLSSPKRSEEIFLAM